MVKQKRTRLLALLLAVLALVGMLCIPSAAQTLTPQDYFAFSGWNFLPQLDFSPFNGVDTPAGRVTVSGNILTITQTATTTAGYSSLEIPLREVMPYATNNGQYQFEIIPLDAQGNPSYAVNALSLGSMGNITDNERFYYNAEYYRAVFEHANYVKSDPTDPDTRTVKYRIQAYQIANNQETPARNIRYDTTLTIEDTRAWIQRLETRIDGKIANAYQLGREDAYNTYALGILANASVHIAVYDTEGGINITTIILDPVDAPLGVTYVNGGFTLAADYYVPEGLEADSYQIAISPRLTFNPFNNGAYWFASPAPRTAEFIAADGYQTPVQSNSQNNPNWPYNPEAPYNVLTPTALKPEDLSQRYDELYLRYPAVPAASVTITTATQGSYASYLEGIEQGKEEGYVDGYYEGRDKGYAEGYADGVNDENSIFPSLVYAVVDAPVHMMRNMLNFEILGVNMTTFVLGILSLALLLALLRWLI